VLADLERLTRRRRPFRHRPGLERTRASAEPAPKRPAAINLRLFGVLFAAFALWGVFASRMTASRASWSRSDSPPSCCGLKLVMLALARCDQPPGAVVVRPAPSSRAPVPHPSVPSWMHARRDR
jgi:hypothetical protein